MHKVVTFFQVYHIDVYQNFNPLKYYLSSISATMVRCTKVVGHSAESDSGNINSGHTIVQGVVYLSLKTPAYEDTVSKPNRYSMTRCVMSTQLLTPSQQLNMKTSLTGGAGGAGDEAILS